MGGWSMKADGEIYNRSEFTGWRLFARLICSVANLIGIQMIRWG